MQLKEYVRFYTLNLNLNLHNALKYTYSYYVVDRLGTLIGLAKDAVENALSWEGEVGEPRLEGHNFLFDLKDPSVCASSVSG